MRSTVLKAALAAGTALNLVALAAQAQTAPPATTSDEVVITGSRVIRNGNNAPTPLTVVTPEQILVAKPTTIYENLVDLPVFSGSRGSSNGPVGNSANGAGAVSSLNLRNMGAQRTLNLFDGHRVPPTTPDGLVDASALPQLLIQRVDVVTGGASAVYGSDAVTGVVNYVTDSKFNGLKLDLQGGVSQRRDDGTYQIGIAAGRQLFNGRGHIEASYQRQSDDGLIDYKRDWTAPRWTVQGNGTTIPWHLVSYLTNATASYGGVISCPSGANSGAPVPSGCPTLPLVGQSFNQNGVLSTYNPGLQGAANGLASAAVQIGGDGVYFDNEALKSHTIGDQFFGRFDFDVTDSIHAYVAASDSRKFVGGNQGVQRSFPPGWKIGACDPYLSSSIQSALGCVPANAGTTAEATFDLEKAFEPLQNYGLGQNNNLNLNNYFVVANLDGRFWNDYRWQATYTHSDSWLSVNALNQNRMKIYAALDTTKDLTGAIVCRVTVTNPGLFPGCAPLNPFGPTAPSQAAIDYTFDWINNTSDNKLDGLSGSLSGAPFKTWAGPVDMAVSGEVRKLTLTLTTTSNPSIFQNCTGLRYNCSATTPIYANGWLPIPAVTQTVSEGAFEANVPLLKDMPFAKDVNFNGAVRYTSYDNNSGRASVASPKFNATTWKAGLVWQATDQLTLRWGQSRDIRAPTLYELYLPQTISPPGFGTDYLINPGGTQVPVVTITGGNPSLTPETANTTTVGAVFRPTPDFSLALDYYSIDVRNVLFSLGGATQPNQLACYASGGTSSICQLQSRPFAITNTSTANAVTAFYTRQVNIARQTTSGLDIEANYRTRVFSRTLSMRGLATYQPHIYYYLPNFAVVQDNAGVAYSQVGGNLPAPVWKVSAFLSYSPVDKWTIDLSERYRSALHWSSDPTQTSVGGVRAMAYTNVTLSHDITFGAAKVNLFLNVQNLFDTDPPPAAPLAITFPGQFPGTYAVGDDVVGRYFTMGLHLRY